MSRDEKSSAVILLCELRYTIYLNVCVRVSVRAVPATQIVSEKAADIDFYTHVKRNWEKFKLIERPKERITITKRKHCLKFFGRSTQAKTGERERAIVVKLHLTNQRYLSLPFCGLLSINSNSIPTSVCNLTALFCFTLKKGKKASLWKCSFFGRNFNIITVRCL